MGGKLHTTTRLPAVSFFLGHHISRDLQQWLHRVLPHLASPTADAVTDLWQRQLLYLLSGDRLASQCHAAISRWPDRWQLDHFYPASGETDVPREPRCHQPVAGPLVA